MNEPLFLGSEIDRNEYFRKHGIKISEPEKPKEEERKPKKRSFVNEEELKPLSNDIRSILEKTRLRNAPDVVYMQSNIDFYDHFYTSNDNSELALEARQIRRLYKSYPGFLHAMRIREAYIDHVIDDFYNGDPEAFIRGIQLGEVDWLPPLPVYSKKSSDYQMSKLGIVKTSNKEEEGIDEEMAKEVMNKILEEQEIDQLNPDDIGVILAVETDLKLRKLADEEIRSMKDVYQPTNMAETTSLQKILQSWYQSDEGSALNEDERLFRLTESEIIRRYNESQMIHMEGDLELAMRGELEEEHECVDMNQMVNDPKTGKPMTRREYEGRRLVRLFAEYGWHELKLMKQLGVGSSYEMASLARASKKRNKYKKIASDIMSDMGGDYSGSSVYGYDSLSALENTLIDGGYYHEDN